VLCSLPGYLLGPLAFGVEEPPARGRPASFGGAIGSGFSLEVSADRSVVRRGDPITLRLTIRGDAHLPTLGPPPLTGPGGLPPEDFRLLEDELSGEVQDGAKRFEATVRVLDEDVREIPAIEYAWFDPETGEYRTTRSRPIALSVRPAEVVSADDVVAATPSGEEAGAGDAGAAARRGAAPGRRDTDEGDAASLALQADLSIEERIDRLVARPGATWPLETALYGGGLAVVLAAASWRRRSRTSPRVARLRALHRAERARIDAAARLPRREGLTEIATALRALSQADPALRSTEVDAFVRECDEILYAPAGDGSAASDTVDADRVRRARALADALGARIR